ncbi:MAG: 3-deoxy-manno-octulosonate cytidylyltransferase [Gammaproteobacteria bacterium]|nr:3-deoxy-manno-octulosonate cytidylyltransferase [Gammaproteobacteria bacterium]
MNYHIVIPARYASTRLPAKPLLDIAGKPMIQHVWERASQAGIGEVIIATDDARIHAAAESFGARVVMTSPEHRSGSDRLAEVVQLCGFAADDIVINVQGDEPLIPPEVIRQVGKNLGNNPAASMATLSTPILDEETLFDPNAVKVVSNRLGHALYFSRAPIPWNRDAFARGERQPSGHQRHLGIYAYRAAFLQRYVHWQPAPTELLESLEQLRVLHEGEIIHVAEALCVPPTGVDTAADLERVRAILAAT